MKKLFILPLIIFVSSLALTGCDQEKKGKYDDVIKSPFDNKEMQQKKGKNEDVIKSPF